MNNKGQVLVIFIIILPILLILLTLIVDLRLLYIDKKSIEDNTYSAISYYLKNKNKDDIEDKVSKLLNKNIKNSDITINDTEEYIEIIVSKEHKSLYSKIFKNTLINVKYKGIKESNRIIKG